MQLRHGCMLYGQLLLNPPCASHSQRVCKERHTPSTVPPIIILKACPATLPPLSVQLRHGCNVYGQLFLNPTLAPHIQGIGKERRFPLTSPPPLCQDVSSYSLPLNCAAKAWMQHVWTIIPQPYICIPQSLCL